MNGPVSKTGIRASVSWVRIPPSPPVKSRKLLKLARIADRACALPTLLPTFGQFLSQPGLRVAYRNINNSAADLPKVSKIVHRLEGYYLKPVHTLLRLPTPELNDPCSFIVAQALLTAIAGASTTLYKYKAKSGDDKKFAGVMVEYYPWDSEPATDLRAEQTAKLLYQLFRNPIAHNAGANVHYQPGREPKILHNKTGLSEEVIEHISDPGYKPSHPTFTVRPDSTPVLRLLELYWGTRILLERLTADRLRMVTAEKNLPDNV